MTERMAEKRTEVRTYMVRLMCKKCDGGEMTPTGICLTSSPPQYPHRCDKCGHQETVRGKTYPRVEHEDAGELRAALSECSTKTCT